MMRNKLIILVVAVLFLVGCSEGAENTIPGEVANVVASWGWEPTDQGGGEQPVKVGSATRGGYAQDKFFTTFNWAGQWVEWNLNVPADGEYRLVLRYSTHGSPQFIRREFTLRQAGADIAAASIKEQYDLPPGLVGNDTADNVDQWKIFITEPMALTAGEQVVRMTFVEHDVDPVNVQFSNVLQIGLVSAEPADATLDSKQIIKALDGYLGL